MSVKMQPLHRAYLPVLETCLGLQDHAFLMGRVALHDILCWDPCSHNYGCASCYTCSTCALAHVETLVPEGADVVIQFSLGKSCWAVPCSLPGSIFIHLFGPGSWILAVCNVPGCHLRSAQAHASRPCHCVSHDRSD